MHEINDFARRRPNVAVLSDDERDLLWARVVGATPSVDPITDEPHHEAHLHGATNVAVIGRVDRSTRHGSRRGGLLAAAAAVAVLGIGATAALFGRSNSKSLTPAAAGHSAAAITPTGPLLTTRLPAISDPLILPSQPGWAMTNAFAAQMLPNDQFSRAVALVGDGPTYDAPLFAASVAKTEISESPNATTATIPTIDALFAEGQPVQVAGTTGAVFVTHVDDNSGIAGPMVSLLWKLDAGHHAVVNGVRLSPDQVVAMANQLTYDGTTLTMAAPEGFRSLPLTAAPADWRHLSYVFTQGDKRFEVVGDNGGMSSLIGTIAAEVRTTRVIDGVETAVRVDKAGGHIRISWLSGEWSFYAMADGFANVDDVAQTLGSLTLVDPASFETAGRDMGLVMAGDHRDLAERVLSGAPLSDEAIAAAADLQMAMSLDNYGFQLFSGAACAWGSQLKNAIDSDEPAFRDQTIAEIQAAIDRNIGTPFERAATQIATLLIQSGQANDAAASVNVIAPCPIWSINR